MKFLHISDLHIGKKLNNISLIEDQRHILKQIIDIAKNLDAVVIAGDVYDKSMPAAEAVELLDEFLTELSSINIPIMIISGNHDSPERLAFGSKIMKNIHICTEYKGKLEKFTVDDVDFYLLPFVKPQTVRGCLGDDELNDYNEMAKLIFTDFQKEGKSVLVMHQFVTNGKNEPELGGSEVINVGTLDNIITRYLNEFDYVALGHIHKPQNVTEKIVYCGSPLKYSFAESYGEKCVIIVDTDNDMQTEKIPLVPLRDMRRLKGRLEDLIANSTDTDDYLHITLTDEEPVVDAVGKLRNVYKNVLEITFEKDKKYIMQSVVTDKDIREKTTFELFNEFYKEQNGTDMSEAQIELVKGILEEAEKSI